MCIRMYVWICAVCVCAWPTALAKSGKALAPDLRFGSNDHTDPEWGVCPRACERLHVGAHTVRES